MNEALKCAQPTDKSSQETFLAAVESTEPVSGLTHNYYRYPGRFSPEFARATILTFSDPGDIVFDPFMGGGTTLVEALSNGRHSVGSDISSLSRFVASVKTTLLSNQELRRIERWVESLVPSLNLRYPAIRAETWRKAGYQRHIPWPIRKSIELALARVDELPTPKERRFARCILLKVGQWALDVRQCIPIAQEFRLQLSNYCRMFVEGMQELRRAVRANNPRGHSNPACLRLQAPAKGLATLKTFSDLSWRPRLVVTSPPYPGVYALYHRWKVQGRKESPAPFWLADCLDGQGQAHYCFGHRKQPGLDNYFKGIKECFSAVRSVVAQDALIVQMLAFSAPDWQLSRFLDSMTDAGFDEVLPASLGIQVDGRLWRTVPGRRWFALIQGRLATSQEVVLFHRPRKVRSSLD
jgi:hypothetical protein